MSRKSVLLVKIPDVDPVAGCDCQFAFFIGGGRVYFLGENSRIGIGLGCRKSNGFAIVHEDFKIDFVLILAGVCIVIGDLDDHSVSGINTHQVETRLLNLPIATPRERISDGCDGGIVVGRGQFFVQ